MCLLTATLSGDGMTDTFAIAALVTGCIDDMYDRNDAASAAASLTLPTYCTGTPCTYTFSASGLYANNDDWYVFSPRTSSLKVALTTTDTIGLELYDSDATTLVNSGTGSIAATTVTANHTYYLHVKPGGLAASCGSKYDLSVQSQ